MRRARVKMMPKNVNRIRGREGVNRYYYRPRNGRPDIRLPDITDPGFAAAHAAAETMGTSTPLVIGESRTIPGSVGAAITEYLSSSAFVTNRRNGKRKSETTTGKERWILDSFRDRIGSNGKRFGDRPLVGLQQQHVQAILDEMREVPASARDLLKALRGLMRWAKRNGRIKVDPTAEVDPPPMEPSQGYVTWEEERVAQFEAHHRPGSKARLALTLLIWTGQRREDIVVMGRQHMRPDGTVRLRQLKTGTEVNIPVLADELRDAIASVPANQLTFLQTEFGKAFSEGGFYNWFIDRCREAGLPPGLALHGLRKTFCCRLADAGVEAADIAAISGHLTLAMVQKYIAQRNKRAGAVRAMTKLVEHRAAKVAGGTK
jgi:integrase